MLERKQATDKSYIAQCAKRARLRRGPKPRSVDNCAVYVAKDLQTAGLENFGGACTTKTLQHVASAKDATVFVVKDLSNISATVKWNAVLCGGSSASGPSSRRGSGLRWLSTRGLRRGA